MALYHHLTVPPWITISSSQCINISSSHRLIPTHVNNLQPSPIPHLPIQHPTILYLLACINKREHSKQYLDPSRIHRNKFSYKDGISHPINQSVQRYINDACIPPFPTHSPMPSPRWSKESRKTFPRTHRSIFPQNAMRKCRGFVTLDVVARNTPFKRNCTAFTNQHNPPLFLILPLISHPNNFLDIISRSHPRHTHPSRRQIQSRSPPPRPHEPLSLSPRPPPTQPIILQLPRQLAHFFLGVVSRL